MVSLIAHTVAAVTIGAVLRVTAHTATLPREQVEVDLAPASNVAGDNETEAAPRASTVVARRRPTSPRARLTHDDDGGQVAPRFVLSGGTIASHGAAPPSSTSPGAAPEADIVAEGDVAAPARLLSTSPLPYPAAARQAEVELDLPLEIVVDTDGRVSAARALTRAGYGLDEAALSAIRAYRFSPAMRAGRPVRVRMRWTVQFRIR